MVRSCAGEQPRTPRKVFTVLYPLLCGNVLEPDGLVPRPVLAALVHARHLPRVAPVALATLSERAHLHGGEGRKKPSSEFTCCCTGAA